MRLVLVFSLEVLLWSETLIGSVLSRIHFFLLLLADLHDVLHLDGTFV